MLAAKELAVHLDFTHGKFQTLRISPNPEEQTDLSQLSKEQFLLPRRGNKGQPHFSKADTNLDAGATS
jgi:hypothetical protein